MSNHHTIDPDKLLNELRAREVEIIAQFFNEGGVNIESDVHRRLLIELEDIEDNLDAMEARKNPTLLEQDLKNLFGEEEGIEALNFLVKHYLVRRREVSQE